LKPIEELREKLNQQFADLDIAPALRQRLKARMEAWLNDLNIVSREEFDAQTKVLQATQAQLTRLEQEIEDLKSQP